MGTPTTKKALLQRLRAEHANWQALLDQIGTQRMIIPNAVDAWSVKDVVAHVMSYTQYIADRAREITQAQTYTPAATEHELAAFLTEHGYPDFGSALLDDDEPNAWVVQKHRDMPLAEVVEREQAAFKALCDAIEHLSDADMQAHDLYSRFANNTYVHYAEHAKDIRHWLAILKEEQ